MSSGCGCKEVYAFPHDILLIPTPLVFALFGSSIPTLLFIFVNDFRSCFCPFLFIKFFEIIFRSCFCSFL